MRFFSLARFARARRERRERTKMLSDFLRGKIRQKMALHVTDIFGPFKGRRQATPLGAVIDQVPPGERS